jgi:hypothetical protein
VANPGRARCGGCRGGVLAVVLARDRRLCGQHVVEPEFDPLGATRNHAEAAWDDCDVAATLVLEEAQLGGAVVLEALVAVQVVRREVEEHRHARAKGVDVLELEARELADDPGALGERAVQSRERPPDVSGDRDVLPGRAEDRAEKLACGRLAVRSGDAHDRVLEEPEAELDRAPDGQPALPRGGRERGRRRYAWAFDKQVHAVEKLGVVRAEDDFDARLAKPPRVEVGAPVRADDLHPAFLQGQRGRLARAGEAEDERLRRPGC